MTFTGELSLTFSKPLNAVPNCSMFQYSLHQQERHQQAATKTLEESQRGMEADILQQRPMMTAAWLWAAQQPRRAETPQWILYDESRAFQWRLSVSPLEPADDTQWHLPSENIPPQAADRLWGVVLKSECEQRDEEGLFEHKNAPVVDPRIRHLLWFFEVNHLVREQHVIQHLLEHWTAGRSFQLGSEKVTL